MTEPHPAPGARPLEEALAEAILAERESCAFLVEQHSGLWDLATIEQCAANIRARGECPDDAIHVRPDRYAELLAAEHALAAARVETARLREALGIALAFLDMAAGEGLAFVEQEDAPAMDAADLCCDIADRLGTDPDGAPYQELVAAGRAHAAARSALSSPQESPDAQRRERDAAQWPSGCIKPNACARHATCMYAQSPERCRHFGKDLTARLAELEAAHADR